MKTLQSDREWIVQKSADMTTKKVYVRLKILIAVIHYDNDLNDFCFCNSLKILESTSTKRHVNERENY